jgi:hypothetical protein
LQYSNFKERRKNRKKEKEGKEETWQAGQGNVIDEQREGCFAQLCVLYMMMTGYKCEHEFIDNDKCVLESCRKMPYLQTLDAERGKLRARQA